MKKLSVTFLFIAIAVLGLACGGAAEEAKTDTDPSAATPAASPDASPASSPADAPKTDDKKDEAAKSDLDPSKIDLEKPIPVGDLRTAVAADKDAWIGKEVSVVGRYGKTTTSTLDGGEKIRVDLQTKDYKTSVGCVVKEKVSEDVVKNRDDRVFKGTIKEVAFDNPQLEPCEFVK